MSYDYIIVGAGSAGCVVAARLTEDPSVRVLLLEAGGRDNGLFQAMPLASRRYGPHPAFNWGYESEPEPFAGNRRIPLPRGRTLGGSSSINGMLYVRGHPRDYDQWRQMGCTGWGYDDVLPYFKKAEGGWRGETEVHGGAGPLTVTQLRDRDLNYEPLEAAVRASGHPATDDPYGEAWEGVSRAEVTVGRGRRASTARAYLRPALSRPNLTVITRALTTRLLLDHGRCVGVEYRRDGQIERAVAEREVILSGGSYNSPQVLMLSGIGPADELSALGIKPLHDLPGVGKDLSEHPLIQIQFWLKQAGLLDQLRLDRATLGVLRWLFRGDGVFASNACAGFVFLRTREGLERPDVSLLCAAARTDARLWFPLVAPRQRPRADVMISLLHPDSRGSVTLRSGDPADPPRILLNLCKEQNDVDAMVRALRMARDIYNTPPLKDLIDGEALPGADVTSDTDLAAYVRANSRITHHPTGTCQMGVGGEAVVDPELRVRGIEGLRIADASVMPTVPGGNTNAPTIMIGEKAADLIRGRSAGA